MRLIVAVVGKPKHESIAAAIRDYEERARRYWPVAIIEVKDDSNWPTNLLTGVADATAPGAQDVARS